MSRQKKSRKISDIMPIRKADKRSETKTPNKKGKKLSRYELDTKAWAEKRKKKHKGLPAGSRHSGASEKKMHLPSEIKDPRIGSRKKVALVIEMVNKPEKGQFIQPIAIAEKKMPQASVTNVRQQLEQELAQLENNECLHQLLDQLDAGKRISTEDQQFVDECLTRIEELMAELGLNEEESTEDLYHTFTTIDINRFR
ncbi:GTPase-activating protein [Mergibacter septicus]|uniref:Der GTPase-activating protein YihI n=1 Tax=Mergibacter septicus TaxID=221402 RepID=UPI0011795773|nr:Der GTPase-activating protein YihI [Mergibacter septicus]AWX13568.1 GTPase-activating protein [Mergibacter septicus]